MLLDEQTLGTTVDRAFDRLTAGVEKHRAQMMDIERELGGEAEREKSSR